MSLPTSDRDWPYEAHQIAERHLGELSERCHDSGDGPEAGVAVAGPAAVAVEAAQTHLDTCMEELYVAEDSGDYDFDFDSVAVGPFCGCLTCQVRESLAAGWRPAVAAIRAGATAPAVSDCVEGSPDDASREILAAAWPVIVEATAAGFVLPDEAAAPMPPGV